MASLHFSRTLADSISKLVNINGIEEKVLQQFHGRKMICRKLSKVSKSSLLEHGESHNPCEIPSTFRINAAKIGKKKGTYPNFGNIERKGQDDQNFSAGLSVTNKFHSAENEIVSRGTNLSFLNAQVIQLYRSVSISKRNKSVFSKF